jgi:hypothetical protein
MDTIDISGKWSLSRILSDDIEEILVLQGFGYFLRKAAKIGTVTLIFKHDPKGAPPTLDITIFPPGGFAKERRTRKIDGHTVIDKHFILGTNNVTWRPRAKGDVDGYFAEEAWEGDHLLEELVESVDGAWTIEGVRNSQPVYVTKYS